MRRDDAGQRDDRPRVVIVGGGFGGLYAARRLGGANLRVTVVDRQNHHLFQPLLYQVATAGLSATDVAAPIRKVLRHHDNITVLLGEVVGFDVERRVVRLADGELPYEFLIVAAGATNHYFGNDGWKPHAPGLKTIADAFEIRRRVLLAYEAAEREPDPDRRRAWLTFVVIGGGPTGVELAGALAEIARHTLARDFRNFDPRDSRVVVIEGSGLLKAFPDALAGRAQRQLEARGVEIRVGSRVETVDDDGVNVGGERIDARTVLWAAGVRASPLAAHLGAPLDGGRVCVEPDLSILDRPEVFVVGDMMAFRQDGEWLPGVAQVAIQSGRLAADNLVRRARGGDTRKFRYRDKGSMATIGRSAAVAQIGLLRLSGVIAWVVWWAIHLFFLIGFRNRVAVMLDWMWAWLSWQRAARVIMTEPVAEPPQAEPTKPPVH